MTFHDRTRCLSAWICMKTEVSVVFNLNTYFDLNLNCRKWIDWEARNECSSDWLVPNSISNMYWILIYMEWNWTFISRASMYLHNYLPFSHFPYIMNQLVLAVVFRLLINRCEHNSGFSLFISFDLTINQMFYLHSTKENTIHEKLRRTMSKLDVSENEDGMCDVHEWMNKWFFFTCTR